tara:strand:- start:22071 stop:22553 length:483 start_codon:yes stop_codon:yes gene_type:complete
MKDNNDANVNKGQQNKPSYEAALQLCALAQNSGILEYMIFTSPQEVRMAGNELKKMGHSQLALDLEALYLRVFGDSPSEDGFERDEFVAAMSNFPGREVATFDNQYRGIYSDIIHNHESAEAPEPSTQIKDRDIDDGEIRFKKKATIIYPKGSKKEGSDE